MTRFFLVQNFLSEIDKYPIFDFSLDTVAVVGVTFGIIWLVVNFYHLYPYVQLFILPVISGGDPKGDLYIDPVKISDIDPVDLPTIDVLLPAYKEGNVIQQSIGSIRRANYPADLININVLLEPDDSDTRAALDDLQDRYEFREITIPPEYNEIVIPDKYPGQPNKPRALNYGFELTDGDIVGIIDAEDVVDPDLFVHVYSGLVKEHRDYVQGILDMINEEDGWLNTIFRSEYAWWYQWLLPAFHYTGYPVPLGGTTNFFHRPVLEEISDRRHEEYGTPWDDEQSAWFDENQLDGKIPWDPRNVTEDFELGMFLWKEGYDMGLLDTVTQEESPLALNQWIRQRTRWQKGKIYSFIQYSYHRPEGWRAKFHLFLQSFLPHLAPINVAGIVILAVVSNALGLGMPVGIAIVLVLGFVFLIEMNVLHAFSYWRATDRSYPVRLAKTALISLTLQLYWIPLWGAEQRAMKQIYGKDLDWEKTSHHGRNVQTADVPPDGVPLERTPTEVKHKYSRTEVIIGILVLLFGLLITIGLPLLVLGL
jgi:cellulose synthase/poly-beta-1,6-N-acetylglucosamine synthase-like glycosyltransferase